MEKNSEPPKEFFKQLSLISEEVFFMKLEKPINSLSTSYKIMVHEQNCDTFEEKRKITLLKIVHLIDCSLFNDPKNKSITFYKIYNILLENFENDFKLQEIRYVADIFFKVKGFSKKINHLILQNLINPVSILKQKKVSQPIGFLDFEILMNFYFRMFQVLEILMDLLSTKIKVNFYEFIELFFEYFSVLSNNQIILKEKETMLLLFEKEKGGEMLGYNYSSNTALLNSILPLLIKHENISE